MLRYVLKIRLKTTLIFITSTFVTVYFIIFLGVTSNLEDLNHPVIIWWTPFQLELTKVINCENKYKCVLTKDRNFRDDANLAAYLFYGSNLQIGDLPLPKDETPWAIYHEESPKNLGFFLHPQGQALFSITSTFSRESSFPIPLQYLRDLKSLTDRKYVVPLTEKNKLLTNLAPVLYIQSDCDTPIERDSIVKELMQYIDVDSYGVCLNNKKLPERLTIDRVFEDLYDDEFMTFVAQYKFILAIENAVCDDYITEKFWRPLIAGSIPVYLGASTVQDWLPNNNSVIQISNYKNISDLAKHIHLVNQNDTMYEAYLQHKHTRDDAITNNLLKATLAQGEYGVKYNQDFPISAFTCYICEAIHEKSIQPKTNVYNCPRPSARNPNQENWWKSHWEVGRCEAKALDYFLNVLNLHSFNQEMFKDQYEKYLIGNNLPNELIK